MLLAHLLILPFYRIHRLTDAPSVTLHQNTYTLHIHIHTYTGTQEHGNTGTHTHMLPGVIIIQCLLPEITSPCPSILFADCSSSIHPYIHSMSLSCRYLTVMIACPVPAPISHVFCHPFQQHIPPICSLLFRVIIHSAVGVRGRILLTSEPSGTLSCRNSFRDYGAYG